MKILSYNYSSQVIPNYSQSELAHQEKNDCFVRAVAAASGSTYEPAHKFVKETFNRVNGQGTQGAGAVLKTIENKAQKVGNIEVTFKELPVTETKNFYKLHGRVIPRDKTVKSFIKSNPVGTYIVLVAQHAFTIKDGVLIDNRGEEFRPTRKVQSAFKVAAKQPEIQLSLF